MDIFDTEVLESTMRDILKKLDLKPKDGFQAVRVAVTGTKVSPPLFDSMVALGKAGCLARLGERV